MRPATEAPAVGAPWAAASLAETVTECSPVSPVTAPPRNVIPTRAPRDQSPACPGRELRDASVGFGVRIAHMPGRAKECHAQGDASGLAVIEFLCRAIRVVQDRRSLR